MELEFTEEQEELRSGVRALLSRECPPSLVREVVETGKRAEGLWSQMVELGWPALTVAEDAGGLGLGFIELAVVLEELGRVVAPVPYLATVTQFLPLVRESGGGATQADVGGRVAAGELTGALVYEGVAAERSDDGWVLRGDAGYVLDAPIAEELAVAARAGDDVGLFLVEAAGVDVAPVAAFDASRPVGRVTFDSVAVGGTRVLCEPGAAANEARTRALEEATVAIALETVGACQTIFDVLLDYAKSREQFGVPIGSFQAVKHKFADMLVALEKARATAYFAALTIAEDDERRALAASMAKAAAGDCQRLLAQEGIQSLGGIGYTWEHDMHLYVKRAKTGDALFGTASTHRARVAELLGL